MTTTPPNWYVITGAPSSGKTTLISLLEERGYTVIHEAARVYIDQEMAAGKKIEEIRKDELGFQKKILEMKIATEKTLPTDELIFLDRGIPDSAAYYELYGVGSDAFMMQAAAQCSYKKVFILDMLPLKEDYARIEDEETRVRLHDLLIKAYRDLGMLVVTLPVMESKQKRAEYLLTQL